MTRYIELLHNILWISMMTACTVIAIYGIAAILWILLS